MQRAVEHWKEVVRQILYMLYVMLHILLFFYVIYMLLYICLCYHFKDIVNYTFWDEVLFKATEVFMSV